MKYRGNIEKKLPKTVKIVYNRLDSGQMG